MAIVGSAEVSAHRADEYLQAARLAIDPARVQIELDLTPGIALAEAIIADIDRNRDGSLSAGGAAGLWKPGAECAEARSRRDAASRCSWARPDFPTSTP